MARRRIRTASQATAGMRIPVFVSCPTDLNPDQDAVRNAILNILKDEMLEARALGRTDYPLTLPLAEVCVIAAHCAGGLILGFEQFRATAGTFKFLAQDAEGKNVSRPVKKLAQFPTPWNHMEASIMFSLGKPLMIMREQGISGGVFDQGVASTFTHELPKDLTAFANKRDQIRQVIKTWRSQVYATYKNVWAFADRY